MKRVSISLLVICLAISLLLSICGCGNKSQETNGEGHLPASQNGDTYKRDTSSAKTAVLGHWKINNLADKERTPFDGEIFIDSSSYCVLEKDGDKSSYWYSIDTQEKTQDALSLDVEVLLTSESNDIKGTYTEDFDLDWGDADSTDFVVFSDGGKFSRARIDNYNCTYIDNQRIP